MFIELPIAAKVRRWLRKLGKQVLVEGYAMGPGMAKVLDGINQTMQTTNAMVQQLMGRMDKMEEKVQVPLVPAKVDNSSWPTPTQYLKKMPGFVERFPKGFNQRGAFDWFVSQKHGEMKGQSLELVDRAYQDKRPHPVVKPSPANGKFVRDCFAIYMANREQPQQGKLRLVPKRERAPKRAKRVRRVA